MGSAMQQTAQTSASGRKTAANGVVIEPFRLVLFALFFLVLGVALGWFTHSYYAVAAGAPVRAGSSGPLGAGPSDEQLRVLLDQVVQAEAQLALRPTDLAQREHLGNLYYDLGEARERLGDEAGPRRAFLRAIEHYEVVRQAGAASPDVLTDLGTTYLRPGPPGQPTRAVGAYEDAIAKDPRHGNAWMNMGVVKRESLNDETGAREAWERFLEISPAGPDAKRVRTWLDQVAVPGG